MSKIGTENLALTQDDFGDPEFLVNGIEEVL